MPPGNMVWILKQEAVNLFDTVSSNVVSTNIKNRHAKKHLSIRTVRPEAYLVYRVGLTTTRSAR